MEGIGGNKNPNSQAIVFFRRLLLVIVSLALISSCLSPPKDNLEEASNLGIYRSSIRDILERDDPQSDGDEVNSPDISGIYLSEITSNHTSYYQRQYSNLILRIKQDGNKVVAFDSTYRVKIEGEIKKNAVDYYVFPSKPNSGNAVTGKWAINADDGALVGKWQSTNHGAGGIWNLRKLEHHGIEFYTSRRGMEQFYDIDDSEELFDMIFSPTEDRNVVFYLHGRGDEFEAQFDPSGIPYIEEFSHTRFVFVRWLSWADISPRPYKHAMASALGLSELLFAFDDYKSRKSETVAGKKVTLLAHSMGNVPLEGFLQHLYSKGDLHEGLFDSILLNSADVPFKGHRNWLEKCDFSKEIFVIQHRRDLVLYLSKWLFTDQEEPDGTKLGTGMEMGDDISTAELAANARYLDLTNLSLTHHKHFASRGASRLFELLLNGQVPVFPDPGIGLYRKANDRPIYYFYSSDPDQVSYPDQILADPGK